MSRSLIALLTVWSCAFGTSLAEQTDGEKSFQSYAALVIGGVWEHTDEDGQTYQHEYAWLIKGRFMMMTGNGPGSPSKTILGVDPKTGKATNWGYSEDGAVAMNYAALDEEGVWRFDGEAHAPGGSKTTWKGILKRVDDNTIRVEFSEGERLGEEIWRRKP